MSESRDRLSRPEDISAMFASRRRRIGGLDVLLNESAEGSSAVTPFRWGTTPLTEFHGPIGADTGRGYGGVGRGSLGSFRSGIRRGNENARPGSSRRARGTILPSWYPRAPLSDISVVSRAIERRRALSLRAPEDALRTDSPLPLQEQVPLLTAQLEQVVALNQSSGEGADVCFTPQQPKQLVNHTDSVVKAVLEKTRMLKSTPSAKRAERKRKVRTLMSMR